MKAIFRRTEPQERHESFSLGDVVLDTESHDVTVAGKPVELTAKEFDLLAFFMANTGIVVSRDVLLDRVWGRSTRAARAPSTCTSRSCGASSADPS